MKTLRNPFTGYKIKEGGKTHQKLLKQFGGHAGPFYQIKYTPEDGTLGRLCYYLDDNSKTQCSAWQTATDHPLYDYMDDPQPDIDLQLGGDIPRIQSVRKRSR